MTKKLKRFEAFLGTSWSAWNANETTTLSLSDGIVLMKCNNPDPEIGKYETTFQLDLIPAYTIQ